MVDCHFYFPVRQEIIEDVKSRIGASDDPIKSSNQMHRGIRIEKRKEDDSNG